MGKTKKPNQVANVTPLHFEDSNACGDVPEEFLTSDDFQVVVLKKRHPKKSPDEVDPLCPRFDSVRSAKSVSTKSSDDEAKSCHSGFWSIRSKSLPEDSTDIQIKSENVGKSNGHGPSSNGYLDGNYEVEPRPLPEVTNGICDSNGNVHESDDEALPKISETAPLDKRPSSPTADANEDETSTPMARDCLDKENNNGLSTEPTDELAAQDCSDEVEESAKQDEVKAKDKKKKQKKSSKNNKSENGCPKICNSECNKHRATTSSESTGEAQVVVEEAGKKSKQREEKDADSKSRKRPSKSQLAAIHEALRKAKEAEEKQKREEDATLKQAEEAERLRQEKLRLEQEKKEKKKLKDKMKKEKMKAEGRLLSKSQKQSRARMQATLEALRQQGIDVPQIGEKRDTSQRRPRLGSDKSIYRKRVDSCQSEHSDSKSRSERFKTESMSSQESSGKESLPDIPSSLESKDSWSLESALTVESELDHLTCSEDSDAALEEDNLNSNAKPLPANANEPVKKSLLAKSKTYPEIPKEPSEKLRSPVICVLGHVDTGKTKILDYIRKTHVQDGEAGGITQQIGATMIPQEALKDKCKMVRNFSSFDIKVPGLLVIDTPGHESFSNLRSRGTSMCDIAILVVDIMHGLEAQTLESINLLKASKIPFVVALNKVDRIYGWKSSKTEDIESIISSQTHSATMEFKERCQNIILQFANQCLNAALFYENKDPRTFISMVPTSAVTGDGMGNILAMITHLTQSMMYKKLLFSEELQATILEVKAIPGLGTTIDVILVNGQLQEGDTIVLAGHDGPVVTQIRSLLMPHTLKELRVKNPYVEYKKVEGAQGVKITGKDLDKSIAGMPLFVAKNPSRVEPLKTEISHLLCQSVNYIKISERGVFVQASTLGSLEALLGYLSSSGVPYFGVKIGPVVKKDVMKASIMLEHDAQYAAILAFDVKVERDAQELSDALGVKIFQADIIYHLFDQFVEHRENILKKREAVKHLAVFPCVLSVVPDAPFHQKEDSLVIRVKVDAGSLKVGTPLCIPSKSNMEVGVVSDVSSTSKLREFTVTIQPREGETLRVFGDDFAQEDYLVSRLTRQSIEVCKEHYMDDVDWDLIADLKRMLHV